MDVPSRIDHTVLGPETTPDDVLEVLEDAIDHGMNACIPPCYLDIARDYAADVTLATVVGFPHGQHEPSVKLEEAETAWERGADEIDLVANVGRLKAGEDEVYGDEIADVVAAVPLPVKVIIEAPLLSVGEIERACELAEAADATMVKTATGFSDGGATIADVELMSRYLPVKASGGIGSWKRAEAMFDAGAERIGASSGVTIVEEWQDAGDG